MTPSFWECKDRAYFIISKKNPIFYKTVEVMEGCGVNIGVTIRVACFL